MDNEQKAALNRVAQDAEAMRLQLDRQTRHSIEAITNNDLWAQYEKVMDALNGLKVIARVLER